MPTSPRAWAALPAVVALSTVLVAGARAETPPPSPGPPLESTTVALLSATGEPAAWEPSPTPAPGHSANGSAKSHDGSHIPTPIDNPWALGLLAALVARMIWMDRPSRQDKS
jgi:hypothetical protein